MSEYWLLEELYPNLDTMNDFFQSEILILKFPNSFESFFRKLLTNDQALNQHRIKIADGIFKNFTKLTATPTSVEIRVVASDRGNNFLYQVLKFII